MGFFGIALLILCLVCDRSISRSFSGQAKWEIGLTFNQNINPEEKRGFAYLVLKMLSVKKNLHPHILARGFEILNYGEVALLQQ